MWQVHDELMAGRIRSAEGDVLLPHPVHYAPFVAWGDALAMRYAEDPSAPG